MQACSFYPHFFPKGDEHGVWLWSSYHSWHLLSYSVISSSISCQRTQSFPGKIKLSISLHLVLLQRQNWTLCAKCNVHLSNTDTCGWKRQGKQYVQCFSAEKDRSYHHARVIRFLWSELSFAAGAGDTHVPVINSFKGTFRTTSIFLQKATL